MSLTARAKYRCNSVEYFSSAQSTVGPRTYTFSAIYDMSTPENQRFTKATPWGELKMRVDNPEVEFIVGTEYYIDFSPAAE